MKKVLFTILKFAFPIAIIAWLVSNIDEQQWSQLRDQPKNWPLLFTAFALAVGAVCVTFVRWFLLVRTLELPFRIRDAFRLGFLGYLFNFVSVGIVGGDLFKAVFIAREQPRRRTEAVATVVVDRVIGLYALLIVTSTAVLCSDLSAAAIEIKTVCRLTVVALGIGSFGILIVLLPGFTSGWFSEFLTGLPKIGAILGRMIAAVRMYRDKPVLICATGAMSVLTHCMFAVAIYFIASSLFESTPPLGEHFLIVPLGMVAGALPFTPSGLGTFEIGMDYLYKHVPAEATVVSGITVALAYRVVTICVAMVGVIYYWTSRGEVRDVIRQAEKVAK